MNQPVDRATAAARGGANQVAGWVPPLARLGYAAKGVVYLIIGWLAFQAANAAGDPEGAGGALQSLRDEGGGQIALYLIAVGLAAHVVWRLVQAVLDPEHHHTDAKRVGVRLFYLLSALVYGVLALTAWQLAQGSATGGGDSQTIWIQKVLALPMGTWLVMAAGIGVIGYGLQQIWKGLQGNVAKRFGIGDPQRHRWVVILGRVGTVARGVVLLPIGWMLFQAGRHYNASEAGSTGEALKLLDNAGLLTAVGIGLAAYGLFQIVKAVYRRIERPVA